MSLPIIQTTVQEFKAPHIKYQENIDSSTYQGYKKKLEKQGYRFIGEHSAIKICEWTSKSLTEKGSCYKQKFYGIRSHRCGQISVAVNFCDKACTYCWRERDNFPFTKIDDPKEMLDKVNAFQYKLLSGFGGHPDTNKDKWQEVKNISHFAISLTGENLYYPRINELIREIKTRGKTSFLVTHGGFPEAIERLEPPTQLYLSMDAVDEENFKKIQRPMHKDAWNRWLRSLDALKNLREKTRTVIRYTLIKDLNDINHKTIAEFFQRGNPHFIEVKSYSHVGASRENLKRENMPEIEEVRNFVKEIEKYSEYKFIDEHVPSRVILMAKEEYPWRIMKFND